MANLQADDFEYNGLNSKDDLQVMMGTVTLPMAPSMTEEATDIPAKFGNQFLGTDYQSKTITIPIMINANEDQQRLLQIQHSLAALLITDDPARIGDEYPLRFGFEPDVTYWGHFTAISDLTLTSQGAWDASLTLTFVMSDPRATKPQVEQPLNGGLNTVTVGGTAQTEPVVQIIPKRNLKYVGFMVGSQVFGLGPDSDEEQQAAQNPYTQVVNDNLGSLAMWTTNADDLSSMTTNGTYKFQGEADSNSNTSSLTVKVSGGKKQFGSTVKDSWYGPALRYVGLTNSLTNYRIKARIHHKKYKGTHNGRAMGDVELLFLDPNGQTIGRFAIKDQSQGRIPYVILQLCEPGGRFNAGDGKHATLYNGKGGDHGQGVGVTNVKGGNKVVKLPNKVTKTVKAPKNKKTGKASKKTIKKTTTNYLHVMNDENTSALSDGWLEVDLIKKGQVFSWRITQYHLSGQRAGQPYVKDPKTNVILHGTFVDTDNKYQSALGSFGLLMMKHDISEDHTNPVVAYKNPYLSMTNLEVYQVNDIKSDVPKYVAQAGQEIMMDCETDQCTVGGKLVAPIWSTDWPKLRPGVNELTVVGDIGDAQMTLKYLPRLL